MAVSYNPRIVTDGLTLCLDAANVRSYPKTGTTWYDLSGRNYHGTLINGPTYNSENNGSIVCDGINDYIETITSYNPIFTVFIWTYPISGNGLFLYGDSPGQPLLLLDYDISGNLRIYVSNYYQTYNSVLTMNRWNLITIHAGSNSRSLYINGVFIGSNTYNFVSQNGLLRLGVQNFLGLGNCRISMTLLYNRILLLSEIKQNYNATKGRYGL